jgi:hypothetical protein
VIVAVSGNVYQTFLSTNPASGLTVTAYKVDGTAARTGSSFTSTTTNAAGAFSLNLETNNSYELEITNGTSYIHAFLPPVTAAKSGIKIIFGDLSTMGMLINGGLIIVMSSSGNIQSADAITLDGGGNINNATSSNGTYTGVQLMDTPFTIALGTIDVFVGDSSSSGTPHTVAYKGVQRKVMVYYLDDYHGSEAIFY